MGSEERVLCLQPTPPPVATKQQYLCQPLLDAVMANIRSPVFNHSLYRTFAPAMSAIHGPPIRCVPLPTGSHRTAGDRLSVLSSPSVCGRKRKHEEDERQSVPNILQGEVARLDVKFLINLDPSQSSNNGTVHLICKLGEWTRWAGQPWTARLTPLRPSRRQEPPERPAAAAPSPCRLPGAEPVLGRPRGPVW